MKYAHQHGCPLNRDATTIAARRGTLEMLKYVRENGFTLHKDIMEAAVSHGHMEVLKLIMRRVAHGMNHALMHLLWTL
jgi:hypothetical protein